MNHLTNINKFDPNIFPEELLIKTLSYLDNLSMAILSVTSHRFRLLVEPHVPCKLNEIGFLAHLADELFLSGVFDRKLKKEETEAGKYNVKSKLVDDWLKSILSQSCNRWAFFYTINDLAEKRGWSDRKIKNFSKALNFTATKTNSIKDPWDIK